MSNRVEPSLGQTRPYNQLINKLSISSYTPKQADLDHALGLAAHHEEAKDGWLGIKENQQFLK